MDCTDVWSKIANEKPSVIPIYSSLSMKRPVSVSWKSWRRTGNVKRPTSMTQTIWWNFAKKTRNGNGMLPTQKCISRTRNV